jgi:ArsR family transcriptional regulator
MGFEPAQLSHWARSAGLVDGSSLYLAQRNGFRVQLRLFVKPQAAPIRGATEALLPI